MDSIFQSYDASVIRPIKEIKFDILGGDEKRRMSVMKGTHGIDIAELFDKQEPKRGGLIDSRMGGTGGGLCATCGLNSKYCDGHFAHIDLAEPIFHPLYLQFVKNFLECICLNCAKLLIQKETDKLKTILRMKSNKNKFVKVHELCMKAKTCFHCGTYVSKIKIDRKKQTNGVNIYSETITTNVDEKGSNKISLNLTPSLIADIFDNISDEDSLIMGVDPKRSHISDMILKVFPVPPTAIRPSLRGFFSAGASKEDSLTIKMAEIVKTNTRFNKHKEMHNEHSLKYSVVHSMLLQIHVMQYYDNSAPITQKNDGKSSQLKPLCDRLVGKFGRIRGHLMGKRGDFTGRTVITGDPCIGINEIGLPKQFAMNLTYREIVRKDNYDRLKQLVKNGTDIYPGANYVYKTSESIETGKIVKPIYLKFRKEDVVLRYGDTVERHLQNGDFVLVNRQPTLHKQSMMAHMVQIIDNPELMTLRLNLNVTAPYNADCDGENL